MADRPKGRERFVEGTGKPEPRKNGALQYNFSEMGGKIPVLSDNRPLGREKFVEGSAKVEKRKKVDNRYVKAYGKNVKR